MKDIVITGKQIRRELWALCACLILALIINACAIIAYKTRWDELFTTWQVTGAVTLVIFFMTGLFRLIVSGVRRFVQRRDSPAPDRRAETK